LIAVAVADDFSGANDCAASFAGAGIEAYAARGVPYRPGMAGRARAVICSVETRFLGPGPARRASRLGWTRLSGLGRDFSFQKIDSTLRGNPGEEVLGMLEACGPRRLAFCPAYPLHGRKVRGGLVTVRGKRLDQSEYARDPLTPSRTARPLELFPKGLGAVIGLGNLPQLRRAIRLSRGRVLCFDAVQARDLHFIARACLAEGIRHFAGASGLSGALAHAQGGGAPRPVLSLPFKRAILAGSVSETTLAQLRNLASAGLAPWLSLEERLPRAAAGAPPRFALSSLRQRSQIRLQGRAFADLRMARLVSQGLRLGGGPQGRLWLLTGGHCAEAFFSELGLPGARVRALLMPGLPLLEAQDASGRKIFATSKPGGFGEPDLMLKFMNAERTL
jgi:uncharacterized protein YgbK (DUF1537 family)